MASVVSATLPLPPISDRESATRSQHGCDACHDAVLARHPVQGGAGQHGIHRRTDRGGEGRSVQHIDLGEAHLWMLA